jgi:hypothetical protein
MAHRLSEQWGEPKRKKQKQAKNTFLESASLTGLLLYSI